MSPEQERDFLIEENKKLIEDLRVRIKAYELRVDLLGGKNEN